MKHPCFIYGLDYAVTDETYSRIKETIKSGIENIFDVEFLEIKELGRVNKVDSLGITYMRVHGMWVIDNSCIVFNYVYTRDFSKDFNFMCIINEEKWNTLSNTDELENIALVNSDLIIPDIRIKNPDNPTKLRNAKLISFTK